MARFITIGERIHCISPTIKKAMEEMKGGYNHKSSFYDFPNGKEYYQALLNYSLGSYDVSVDDIMAQSKEASNELLEDKDFPIAEKLLKAFIEKRQVQPEDVIILNGLPRHVGQANALSNLVNIKFVLFLNCPPEVAYERIKYNSGGDRTDRTDDSLEEVKRKVNIFYDQTFPLIEYYRSRDINIVEVAVDIDTLPLFIIQDLGTLDAMV